MQGSRRREHWVQAVFVLVFVLNSNNCFQLCSVFRHATYFHFDHSVSAEAAWLIGKGRLRQVRET